MPAGLRVVRDLCLELDAVQLEHSILLLLVHQEDDSPLAIVGHKFGVVFCQGKHVNLFKSLRGLLWLAQLHVESSKLVLDLHDVELSELLFRGVFLLLLSHL